jgi:hypothetical protein
LNFVPASTLCIALRLFKQKLIEEILKGKNKFYDFMGVIVTTVLLVILGSNCKNSVSFEEL